MENLNAPRIENRVFVKYASFELFELAAPFHNLEVAFHFDNADYPSCHNHDHWEILVVTQGEIMHTVNGQQMVFRQGDACLLRPNDKHCLKALAGTSVPYLDINFIISCNFAQKILSLHRNYEELLNAPNPMFFRMSETELSSIYDKCVFTQNLPKEQYEASVKIIVAQIILNMLEQDLSFNSKYPVWLNNFLLYISNPVNFDKPLQELSRNSPYSYSRLSVLFKDYTGSTLVEYLAEKKMTYAKRLLRTTSLTTLQISEKIGYASLSAFNHVFKKAFNMTPSQYRKTHK